MCVYIRSLTHTHKHTGSAQGFLRVLITEEKPPVPAGIQFTCFTSTNVQILTPEKHRASSSSSSSWFLFLRLLYICPHTTMCVLTLQHMCPHTTMCVLILQHMCPHITVCVLILQHVSSYYYVCPHTTTYVSSCYSSSSLYLDMCPHTTLYLCVLILV